MLIARRIPTKKHPEQLAFYRGSRDGAALFGTKAIAAKLEDELARQALRQLSRRYPAETFVLTNDAGQELAP